MNLLSEKILSHSDSKRRTTVLSPILWAMGIIIPPCFYYILYADDGINKLFCWIIIILVLLYFVYNFEWFKRNAPDRLHTEEYLLTMRGIEVMASQGNSPIAIDKNTSVALIERSVEKS